MTSLEERVRRTFPGDEQSTFPTEADGDMAWRNTQRMRARSGQSDPLDEPPPPRLLTRVLDAVTDWIFTGKARP